VLKEQFRKHHCPLVVTVEKIWAKEKESEIVHAVPALTGIYNVWIKPNSAEKYHSHTVNRFTRCYKLICTAVWAVKKPQASEALSRGKIRGGMGSVCQCFKTLRISLTKTVIPSRMCINYPGINCNAKAIRWKQPFTCLCTNKVCVLNRKGSMWPLTSWL